MNPPLASRRHWAYGLAAAALIALNVWRWWPDAEPAAPVADGGPARPAAFYRPEDFRVARTPTAQPAAGKAGAQRNPFALGAPPRPETPPRQAPRPRREPAQPSPQALAAAKARATQQAVREALGRFKVAAIRMDAGQRQALLLDDAGTYVVVLGDLVGDRYRVDDISFDSVRLTDTVTRVSEHIPLTGN